MTLAEQITVELVIGMFSLAGIAIGAVTSIVNTKRTIQARDIAQSAVDEVTNAHGVNIRTDLDDRFNRLDAALVKSSDDINARLDRGDKRFDQIADSLQGLHNDRRALDDRVTHLEAVTHIPWGSDQTPATS